jgi:hypothetical protein
MLSKKTKKRDILFLTKYKSFLEAKTKLNYSKRSLFHKSRKTELGGEGGADWPTTYCDPISSQQIAKGRYSGFIIVDHERSKHNTEVRELRDYTVFLPQCGKGNLSHIVFAVAVTYRFWSAVCFLLYT